MENNKQYISNKLDNKERTNGLLEENFRVLAENAGSLIFVAQEGKYVFVNPAFEQITRYSAEELYEKYVWEIIDSEHREIVRKRAISREKGGFEPVNYEFKLLNKAGEVRWIDYRGTLMNYDGKPAILGSGIDVTERKRTEERLRLITDNMLDMIALIDVNGKISYASPSFAKSLGYESQEMEGQLYRKYLHKADIFSVEKSFIKNLNKKSPGLAEHRLNKSDGNYLWVETVGNPIINNKGKVSGVVLSSRNIDEKKQAKEKLAYLEVHDTLTKLYNWRYFEKELVTADKNVENRLGLIVSDLDGLKLVNDTLGYSAGDTLLIITADILRTSCPIEAIIARVGGDEFAVLIKDISPDRLKDIAQNIYKKVNSYNESNTSIPLSLSLGVAHKEINNQSLVELMQKANQLMYREKLLRKQSARSALVDVMMKALEARDFVTEGHTDRLHEIVEKIARAIDMPEHRINDLCLFARFHDIGKVGVADHILLKPAKLSNEEMEEMKKHSEIGFHIAQSSSDLAHIADWILKHHEKWDGSGYPLGLKENEIPLECRILSIADAYDAMSNDRPYRKAMKPEEIVKELKNCCAKQFDPKLLRIFCKNYLLIDTCDCD